MECSITLFDFLGNTHHGEARAFGDLGQRGHCHIAERRAGNRVAVRARGGVAQQPNETFFDVSADYVLPLAGFVVGALPRKPDDVDKESFG